MRRIPKATTAMSLAWLTALAVAGAPVSAIAQSSSCLAPSGGDDTAALQEALETCSGETRPCAVRLCAGVFDTGILRVRDFRGTLRGAGARATVLRAKPDLEVSANPQGFFRNEPFGSEPWPYLLQFVEGRAAIRDLGILIPEPPPGSRPTTSWTLLEGYDPTFELRGALLLTGRDPVDFEVSRVRVVAETDRATDFTTAFHGIELGGLLYNSEDPGGFPVFPATGSFKVTDSEILGVLSGTLVGEVVRSSVRVAHNRLRSAVAVDLIDADRSQVAIVSNRWDVSVRGVQVLQNLDGSPSRASGILVDDNEGSLVPASPGVGDGIAFQDPIDASPDPGGSILWATRNRLTLGSATSAAASGITAVGSSRLKIAGNRLSGKAAVGIDVDVAEGCLVLGNAVRDLDTAGGPDLHLGPDTSDCLAIVGKHDLVQDHGSNNRVIRR